MQEAYTPAVRWRHPVRRGWPGRGGILSPAPTALLFGVRTLVVDAPGNVPCEGVREMLAALSAAGYPLGIVGGVSRELESALGPATFEVTVTDHDALQSAPERLKIPVEKVAFIGHSLPDLSAARAAGMAVGVALWSCEPPEDFRPEWLFERPADVTRAFARWC